MRIRRSTLWALLISAFLSCPTLAQFTTSSFGQNKVNLRDFDWRTKQTEHFTLYYYGDSAPWVDATAKALEDSYRQGTTDLKISFDERRSFFLYASVNDMEQGNVVTVGDGTGGVTEPLKDRFQAYSDGSQNWLEDVIHHEFTHVCQYRVLIDGGWRSAKILKSVIYPIWFMEGMAEYHTGDDDITLENQVVRDRAVDDNLISLTKLEALTAMKPHEVTTAYKEGASAIRFLASQYGPERVGELLKAFDTRFDASSALGAVIGTDLPTFDKKFREYEHDMFARQVARQRLEEPRGRQITPIDSIPQFNTTPVFLPDGKSIAYLSTDEGFGGVLKTRDLATGETREIIGHSYTWIEYIPLGRFTDIARQLTVSPDGRTAAFVGQKNHQDRIFLADLRTERLSYLTFPGMMTIQEPSYSPDGKKLAFAAMRHGHTDIFLYDLDSQTLENLTNDPQDDQSPAFSPDGSKLVWSQETTGPDFDPDWQRDIMMMDLRTRKVTRLTQLHGSARDPFFSPDGKKVVFEADPDFVMDLYELDLATGRVLRRTRSIGGAYNASYSPDGQSLMYTAYRHNNHTIYIAPLKDLLAEDVTESARRRGTRYAEGEVQPGSPASGAATAMAPVPPVAVSTAAVQASTAPPASATAAAQVLVPAQGSTVPAASPIPYMTDTGPAKDSFSPDLFLPAFFFSSYGGLFWTSYFQGSDFLGNHSVTNFINYNSGLPYLNYSLLYTYSRYRPQWFIGAQGLTTTGVLDEVTNLDFDYYQNEQFVGMGYPFDRYHRLELALTAGEEYDKYQDVPITVYRQTRSATIGVIRDTAEGRYLVATRGSRLALQLTKSFEALGGNQDFTTTSVEYQQFTPVTEDTTFAVRTIGIFSTGPDARPIPLGGLGYVRGYQKSIINPFLLPSARAGTNVAFANSEFRFPVLPDINVNLWFLEDLLIKSLYGVAFYDLGYSWYSKGELQRASWSDVAQSAGLGVNIYAFALQRFELVASMDYANQLTGNARGHVFYIYLGPLF